MKMVAACSLVASVHAAPRAASTCRAGRRRLLGGPRCGAAHLTAGAGRPRSFAARVARRSALSCECSIGTAAISSTQGNGQYSVVLVWFKHDLRTDDHPGMVAAAACGGSVVPFFCFDPKNYVQILKTPGGATALKESLTSLQRELRQQGSDLIVRMGSWETVLPEVAEEFGCTSILTEEEVEHRTKTALSAIKTSLKLAGACQLDTWRLSIFDPQSYEENFREFAAKRGAALEPLSCPRLPAMPAAATEAAKASQLPTLQDLQGAAADLQRTLLPHQRSLDDDEWVHEMSLEVIQGESDAVKSLEDFFSYELDGERTALHKAIEEVESPAGPGGSFRAVFSQALMLGTLSRRRVYQLATTRRQTPLAGLQGRVSAALAALSARPTGDSISEAAAECAITSDFHWQLAEADSQRQLPSGLEPRYWRWRGMLTQYLEAEPEKGCAIPNAPPLLLVHGFGAFGEHWRGNIKQLAARGFRVFAPTYPGYGRSEKTVTAYGPAIWTDFLRDFVLDCVGEPVVVAGNSIGGFLSASMAADNPDLVAGLVLINSAGPITPGYSPPESSPQGGKPPFWVADSVSKMLITYLEGTIGQTLAKLYPTNPKAADSYLADEIFRAACDPGALGVFRSVFYLPSPRPLNFLVDTYAGPTLILQGELDPLNDAKGRALSLKRACSNEVQLELLTAGHCPHDETPELVNHQLEKFAVSCIRVLAVDQTTATA